jgi:hypothetical protein
MLEFQHHGGQFRYGYGATVTQVTDFKILAEVTQKAAIGEEDGPGAMAAYEFRFFAKMRMKTADDGLPTGFTVAQFVFDTVDTAFTGADRTCLKVVDLCFHLDRFKS